MTAPDKHANKQKVRTSVRPTPSPDAYAFTITDAQKMGAPGRTKIYDLKKRGELKTITDGVRHVNDNVRAYFAACCSPHVSAAVLGADPLIAPPRDPAEGFSDDAIPWPLAALPDGVRNWHNAQRHGAGTRNRQATSSRAQRSRRVIQSDTSETAAAPGRNRLRHQRNATGKLFDAGAS